MADYITPEQAKALQDQYNQALADADRQNQEYQNALNSGSNGTNPWASSSQTGNGYTATGSDGSTLVVNGAGSGNSQAQAVVNNSYNAFINQLQQISANTGVPMSDLVNMAANTPGYGTWQNGQLVIRDPNTGKYYYSGGASGGNTTPGTGITGTVLPQGATGGTDEAGDGTTGGQIPGVNLDNRDAINSMYDAQINAQRAALQEQGDQALSDAQANRDKIADLYNTQRNAASVDWERQRRNFLEGAATSGLNTGAGSQAELSMNSMYQNRQNTLGAAQAQAEAEADRNIADIRRSTQASINEAIAKNDYQKAAALLDEYNNLYSRYEDRAKALASFGDFTGYAALYGNELATQMFYNWAAQNPATAYKMGAISDQQYNNLMMGLPINSEGAYNSFAMNSYGGGYDDPWAYGGSGWNGSGSSTPTTTTNGSGSGGAPSYSGMTPETYAAYINSLVASGQLTGAEGQQLIREAYGQTG